MKFGEIRKPGIKRWFKSFQGRGGNSNKLKMITLISDCLGAVVETRGQ